MQSCVGGQIGDKMTKDVEAQYEAYPYPERDPADEAKRLITGSPSFPQEMDHYLWGGRRDWTKPLRILVAGGGTGDGLIQLCQILTTAGRPYHATYLDLSRTARAIAEERARVRALTNIEFHTGTLLNAADLGEFDYIDCCGVLHHLSEPAVGLQALVAALASGGGLGLMVYAPHGRSGVYALQNAFSRLTRDQTPAQKLELAKAVFPQVPKGHPFSSNPHLVDHKASDAGFFDLLLHSSDRPFTISEFDHLLSLAGLELAGVPEPGLYDPRGFLSDPTPLEGLTRIESMQLAEDLRGTMKTHTIYAKTVGSSVPPPFGKPFAVPKLRGTDPRKLAGAVAKSGTIRLSSQGQTQTVKVPSSASGAIERINGRRNLDAIRSDLGLDQFAFNALWTPFERALTSHGLLHYSAI